MSAGNAATRMAVPVSAGDAAALSMGIHRWAFVPKNLQKVIDGVIQHSGMYFHHEGTCSRPGHQSAHRQADTQLA
jgi:hypothetical protein